MRVHTFKGNVWGATIWGPPFFVRITLSNKGEVENLRAPLSVEVRTQISYYLLSWDGVEIFMFVQIE